MSETWLPSRCDNGRESDRRSGAHPLRSSTACVQDASKRVFRLTARCHRDGLRLRVSAGLRTGFPHLGRDWL